MGLEVVCDLSPAVYVCECSYSALLVTPCLRAWLFIATHLPLLHGSGLLALHVLSHVLSHVVLGPLSDVTHLTPIPIIHPHNPGLVSTGTTRIVHSPDNEYRKFSKNSPIWVRIIVAPGHYTSKPRTRKVALVDNPRLPRYYQPPPQPHLHIPNHVSKGRTRIIYPPDNVCPEFRKIRRFRRESW